MVLRGIKEARAWQEKVKRENLERWYESNPWARDGRERDICDDDYPGRGLEALFWDIPN